jgi:hypothetical protein
MPNGHLARKLPLIAITLGQQNQSRMFKEFGSSSNPCLRAVMFYRPQCKTGADYSPSGAKILDLLVTADL